MKYNFSPGPSRVYDCVLPGFELAFKSGILGINHRSDEFKFIYKHVIDLLRIKLNIPTNFTIIFLSSSTQAWHIISRDLVHFSTLFIGNGSFADKWFGYHQCFDKGADFCKFTPDYLPDLNTLSSDYQLVNLVHNETSNGTCLPNVFIKSCREAFPSAWFATDLTSSLGGVNIDWSLGDIFFASVQKCLGLPSGLGLLFLSDKFVNYIQNCNYKLHYDSLPHLIANAQKFQTHCTPNIATIYLLSKVLESVEPIACIEKKLQTRKKLFYEALGQSGFLPLVTNPMHRSTTVFAVKHLDKSLERFSKIQLGSGYGKWKDSTFRIANFPAISDEEFDYMLSLFV